MNTNPNTYPNQNFIEEESSIDIKKWLVKILSNWYIFFFSILAFGIGCYFLNRTINPLFKTSSTVLIEEVKQRSMMGAQDVMQDFGVGAYRNVNNQIVLLSSYSMVKRTVDKLPLNVDYHYENQLRKYPYYKNAPIEAQFSNINLIPSGVTFTVKYQNESECILHINGTDEVNTIDKVINFDEAVKIGGTSITISKTESFNDEMNEVFLTPRSTASLVAEFSSRMVIDFVMDEATIVEVSLISANAGRDVDFLNTLIEEFLNDNLERKNEEAIRTIDFITEQLQDVAQSLNVSENSLQDYRSQNNVINISSQTSILINKTDNLETQKANLLIKKDYYNYLKDYLNSGEEDAIISPSTIGIDDPVVSAYIKQYSEVQFDKQMLAPKAPYRSVAEVKLIKIKASLIEATKNAIKNTELSIADANQQLEDVYALSEQLPSKERKLIGIQRQLNVNDTYYTYLLQKRSEAQIQQASNSPDNMLIDEARTAGRTNQKKTRLNYIIAIMLGGGIPLAIIILIELLNNKVNSKEDIEAITKLPILGSIAHTDKDHKIETLAHTRSTFTESFRALRTRLTFMQGNKKSYSIMLTSAVSGEGKTFVAINLAGIFALSGKKTVLVGFDLRKPKIAEYLDKKSDKGLSNYLAGHNALDEVTFNHGKNLDIIYSGTIPPNPGELCADKDKNNELFSELRNRYDYIIVDSTPVGMVADAFLTGHHVDTVLFIAKHNYTHKGILEESLAQVANNNLTKVGIVTNDISLNKSTYRYSKYIYGKNYAYGYGSGYGYGNTYYAEGNNGYTEN